MGKRGAMNQKSNKLLKDKFLKAGKTNCEICGSNQWLTFMHRKKRRYYTSLEELSDMNEVILACMSCHQKLEFNREETENIFSRLR